jgi:hypothetical protein
MFKRLVAFFLVLISFFSIAGTPIYAVENPLSKPNNKMGIHILFDTELQEASRFINSSGGDWGYVIIPIQAGDKDLIKWQKFMDSARQQRVIPIVRLATEGDYFNTSVWRKPKYEDIIDFANFLDSLEWPTKNRYVVVFNEVNRGDEWGGAANPAEYAQLLSFAVTVFKSKDQDFFMINAGLDNAAPRKGTDYMNQYDYIKAMDDAVPGIFNQIDGWSSHSYPNPGFSQAPNAASTMGVGSFAHEKELVRTLSSKDLPVFITETGWTTDVVPDELIAQYYQQTWNTIWSDPSIVAITPFLLQAHGGPFQQFTLIKDDGSMTKQYEALKALPKRQGYPTVNRQKVLAATTQSLGAVPPEIKDFSKQAPQQKKRYSLSLGFENAFKWFIGI